MSKLEFTGQVSFHGGCGGCTQQEDRKSYEFCMGCHNFAADWDLPDLNNRKLFKSELIRIALLEQEIKEGRKSLSEVLEIMEEV